MSSLLLVVEETFRISGRDGLVIAGACPELDLYGTPGVTGLIGAGVEFRTKSGKVFDSTLLAIEFPNPLPKNSAKAALMFPKDLPEEFKEAGTEVWLMVDWPMESEG